MVVLSDGLYTPICNVLVAYWISWEGGVLVAGMGNIIGVNKIAHWRDSSPSFQVNSMSVSSSVNATWSIPNRYYITGNSYYLYSSSYLAAKYKQQDNDILSDTLQHAYNRP